MKPWTKGENATTVGLSSTAAFLAGALSPHATDGQVFLLGFAFAASITLTFLQLEARRTRGGKNQ